MMNLSCVLGPVKQETNLSQKDDHTLKPNQLQLAIICEKSETPLPDQLRALAHALNWLDWKSQSKISQVLKGNVGTV